MFAKQTISRLASVLISLVLVLGATEANGQSAPLDPGIDLFTSIEGGDAGGSTSGTHADFAGDPIPADFFGPGSDPFEGQVCLGGVPLGPMGFPEYDLADTLILRSAPAVFDRAEMPGYDLVEIEIVELHLVSLQPIVVTYDDGFPAESFFDVYVEISFEPYPPEPCIGQMALEKTHPDADGGMILRELPSGDYNVDSFFDITYRVDFVPVEPGDVLSLERTERVDLRADAPWSHTPPSGAWITPETSNFFPGATPDAPCMPLEPLLWDGSVLHLEWLLLAEQESVPGDLNSDCFVGQGDLDIILDQWGHGDPPDPPITDWRADTNGDGFVGQSDLDYVLDHWGDSLLPPESSVPTPEPGTLLLLLSAVPAMLLRRTKS